MGESENPHVLKVIRDVDGEFKVVAINNSKIADFNVFEVPNFKKHPSHKEVQKHLNKKKHFLLKDEKNKKVKRVKGTLRLRLGDTHPHFKKADDGKSKTKNNKKKKT